MPKKGCFKATYPKTEWEEVPCATAPNRPYPPARGPRPETVGNGNDFTAQVSGLISSAVGSFDGVTGVTSESGNVGGNPPLVANTFSLQLNTNFFTNSNKNVPACNGAANPTACQGWQQFVYSNSGCSGGSPACAFMQYWVLNFATNCPTGWNTSGSDCWRNGNGPSVPVQTIANLDQLRLTGMANSGGTDTIVMETSGPPGLTAANQDSVLDLARNWQAAEFNVFGDYCWSQADFNFGSTIVVRTSANNGTTNAPSRLAEGFTGETNNLNLVSACSPIGGASPAIVFTETFGGPPAATEPFVNVYSGHDQQHFGYLAASGEVWDAFYCPGCSGDKWRRQEINSCGATSGPPAAAGPFVDTYAEADQQHFAYLAANGEIWDAFYCPGCSGDKWRIQKINNGGATTGPPTATAPFVNVFSGHNQQHFAYLATNENGRKGDIWDAFYCPDCSGDKWRIQKINNGGATSGPPAVSGPFIDTYA
ncbi:MAG: hypothetical protein WCC90_20050, partial [Methylocella sp.]